MATGKKVSAKPPKSLIGKSPESEVEAYHFIRENLKELGWIVKNPSRFGAGQVWTQNQCLEHPAIKAGLNLMRPENIVKLSESQIWVIEAKSKKANLNQALREAELDYASPINKKKILKVALISGVAGNDDAGYEIRTKMLVRGRYESVTINGVEATGLLDPRTVETLGGFKSQLQHWRSGQ